jgi:hypothetical protein
MLTHTHNSDPKNYNMIFLNLSGICGVVLEDVTKCVMWIPTWIGRNFHEEILS